MRIVYLNSDSPYIIGKQGETQAVTLRVDVTDWVADFPNGTGVILFTRPNKVVYPLETNIIVLDGKTYLQTIVTTKENNVPGWVVLQAQWYNGETLVKSMMFSGKVLVSSGSSVDPTETVPDWVTEWMETFRAAVEGAGDLIAAAETMEDDLAASHQAVSDSEAWAKGTRSGEAVESTDDTYHNNSKYYAEQSADAAEDTEAWANGTRGGVDIDSDDPAYHKNGKYYNTQAAASASAAAMSASQAMTDTPEGYTNVVASIAPEYDGTATYSVGDYCLNGGKLYRCTTAITEAEVTFNSSHWTEVDTGGEIANRAVHWLALNPSDYGGKLANVQMPVMAGVSNDDAWTDRPSGVTSGTFLNFKYNASYASQVFIKYPGQSVYIRLVNVSTGAVTTNWVNIPLKSDMDSLVNVYLHAQAILPSQYDTLLAKVTDICVAGIQNTDAWSDKPGSETAGTFINFPYNATYATQMFISYPGQRFYARLTDKTTGTALTNWIKYALASEIDTLTSSINGLASSYMHTVTLTPSQYDNKLAKVSVPCLAGISNTDTWNDKPSGVTAGTFLNFKYNSGYATQMIVTYPGQSVYVRLADLTNGSAATDWVKITTSSDISALASTYLHRISATPSSYSNLLAKISLPCIFAVGNTAGWEDKPSGVDAGTFVNFAYDGTNSTQVFISYPKEKIFVRLVSSSGSVLVGWKQLAGNYDTVWYALGDSITAGSYSNDDGEGIVATNAEWAYPNRAARSNFCTVHNLGVPGAAITEMGSQAALVGADATLITITGGANDYYMKTLPLGSASSTKDYTTVCGALKSVIETVAATAPLARIVLISPLIIKYGTMDTKWSLNHAVQNKGNFTYAELSDAMKDIAEYYNVEFIDGTRTGPTNILNISSVQKDGVHPTKEYYNAVANWIGSKLF